MEHATTNMAYVRPHDAVNGQIIEIWRCNYQGQKQEKLSGALRVASDDRQELPVGVSDSEQFAPIGLSSSTRSLFRLRPKGGDEFRIQTDDLLETLKPLQGGAPSAPGAPLMSWPAAVGFTFYASTSDMLLACKVVAITAGGDPRCMCAMFTPETSMTFESGQPNLKIKGQETARQLFRHDFDVQQLGIGGLDKQFAEIFRGAFASRAVPPHVSKAMGLQHTKGILLYGPPGTGKTLIARQIGKLLNAVEPKVVNGPEVLDKFVGESEKKVRELFADAERDESALAEESPLHVIIFDEIDAICKQRGSVGGGTGVHDSIVNTLLTKIDGVDSLNNILLIGMTNRPDLLDEALTRPGRIELKVEIGLPDEEGRQQILNIHTQALKKNSYLGKDVSIPELAERTRNFTGAELQAVVRRATNWALDENLNKSKLKDLPKEFHPVVERRHFLLTLEKDIRPAFGAFEETLATYHREGIFDYGPRFNRAVEEFSSAAQLSESVPKSTILLCGQAGTGKTALATFLATRLKFPFVKVIDFFAIMGKNEGAASDVLRKAFDDAAKSPLSVVILDDVSKLVQYARHGPRYSLLLLHTLESLMKQRPPPERRMVVLATADVGVVRTLDLADSFAHVITLPMLTRDEAARAIHASALSSDPRVAQQAVAELPQAAVFGTSIRTLTTSLLHSSPTGRLDLDAWSKWQHAFMMPTSDDGLLGNLQL